MLLFLINDPGDVNVLIAFENGVACENLPNRSGNDDGNGGDNGSNDQSGNNSTDRSSGGDDQSGDDGSDDQIGDTGGTTAGQSSNARNGIVSTSVERRELTLNHGYVLNCVVATASWRKE